MFLVEPSSVSHDVVLMVLEKCGVTNPDQYASYVGLFESKDGAAIDGVLAPDERVCEAVQRWGAATGGGESAAKLVFMIRLFMPCLWGLQYKDRVAVQLSKPVALLSLEAHLEAADVRDESLVHIQYLQAVYHVVTGQYPTTSDQAVSLGTLHFLFKFGEYRPASHRAGFLGTRIVEFIPIKHLRTRSIEEWEQVLLDSLRNFAQSGGDLGNPQRRYMELIFRMSIYGCSFFRCTQRGARSLPENLIVGIHHQVRIWVRFGDFEKERERNYICTTVVCSNLYFYFHCRSYLCQFCLPLPLLLLLLLLFLLLLKMRTVPHIRASTCTTSLASC